MSVALEASTWSPQQEEALKAVSDWLKNKDSQVFRLFGYAGTGKTTLAKEIAANVKGLVLFGAFTGKAAQVLRSKDCDGASTIHSMIYEMKEKRDGTREFKLNRDSDVARAKLVIIDECSMVDQDIGTDLLSFDAPVLVLGDPAQLPPVKGGGFFTDQKPDYMLTEVHRQARDNPIIELSMAVREGRRLPIGDHGAVQVIRKADVNTRDVVEADQVLCGLNKSRASYNRRLRELLGRESMWPESGDRLVCLKNNNSNGLFNGSIWQTVRTNENVGGSRKFWIENDDGVVMDCDVLDACWDGTLQQLDWRDKKGYDEFDYGYALTVHKSQGSQWNNVYLFDESGTFRDDAARWLYTGITRAAERLTVAL